MPKQQRSAVVRRAAVVGLAVLFWLASVSLPTAQAQSATGSWQLGPNLPFFPGHDHVLPDGRVMMWPGDEGINGDDARAWDPASGTVTPLGKAGFDIFCSGHSFLPDGRLFVAGGHISNGVGLANASIYSPTGNTWQAQPPMNLGRWYPTTTVLANGDVLVVSGDVDASTGVNPVPQVWQAATGTWRSLSSANLQQPLYPYMFLAPDGRVFDAGPGVATRLLNTAGSGGWSLVGNRTFGASRDYGSAVMYEPGKIVLAGGGDPPTATAEVIDLNAASRAWRTTGSMHRARRQMNLTMLPDGKVLATGGTSGAGFNDPNAPAQTAEMWDPATGIWTDLAAATLPRLYHSIALLLPDGRILTTGGNGYTQTEIYSPPYLFAGARPSISSAPAAVGRGQSFVISTPDAATINAVAWVRLPSVTHTNGMSQGFFRSTQITHVTGGIQVTAPNLTSVPSGHYMLFVLRNGVPSVAKIVNLGSAGASNPVPALASLAPTSTAAGSPPFTLTVNGSNFLPISTVRWNGGDRTTAFVSATRLQASIPAADVASAGTAQVTVATPAPGGGISGAQAFTITAG
ncbi:MAG: galactose oxidase, partial [Pseudonocardiales bacterium]|nr:galactose oxidase [Pseudonocardiales bacterium]